MDEMYFTIAGCRHYFGSDFMKKGMKVKLVKEPDNEYDKEAIQVKVKGFQSGTHKVVENQSLLPYGMARRTIKRLYRDKDNRIVSAMTNWEIRQKQKWCLLLMVELCAGLPSLDEQSEVGAYFSNLDHLITLHQRESE